MSDVKHDAPKRGAGWLSWPRVWDHLRLALPLCAAHMGIQLMAMVDIAMVGHYSKSALAGSGIGANYVFVISVVGAGIVLGMDACLPKAVGGGDRILARAYFDAGVRIAKLMTIPMMALVALGPFLLHLAAIEAPVTHEASRYIWPRLIGIFPYVLFFVQRSYLQSFGRTRAVVLAVVFANILNAALDGLLIYGDDSLRFLGLPALGLPAMGSMGAGLATSLVSIAVCVFVGFEIRSVSSMDRGPRSPEAIREVLRLGFPIAGQLLVECGIFALTGFLSGVMGAVPAAAHQVALALAAMSFSMALGMAAATSVKVGQHFGRGNLEAAKQSGYLGIGLGALMMGAAGLLFIAIPDSLASLFTSSPTVHRVAVSLLGIAAIFQLSDAIQAIGAGALRGIGETRATFIANALGHYGIGMPLAIFLAFYVGTGVSGLWWGLSAGLTAVAYFLVRRFSKAF